MTSSPTCRRPSPTSRSSSDSDSAIRKSRADTTDLIDAWLAGLAVPPAQTVSQWADAHRLLPPEAPLRGKWRTDAAPYQREAMDAANDPDVHTIVLMWSSQVGKSETLNNVIGYHMHADPAAMLMVQPTLKLAEDYSDERIASMLRDSPALAALVGDKKTRDATDQKLKKSFPGGYIAFAGANSPGSIASRPVRIALADEIDKYAESIGRDGDPVKQLFQRTTNFWNRKRFLTSTPTLAGASAIERWYKKSDRREYWVPCPACGEHQFLHFFARKDEKTGAETGGVRWDKGQPETAAYCCRHCGVLLDQKQLRAAVREGYWKALGRFSGIAGFHINSLYSPWVSMAQLAAEWEEAEGNPAEEQTFVNLKLGLPFNPASGADTTPQRLYERREDWGTFLPREVLLITAGVDVQHDRLEVQWIGWGAGDEKWVLDHVKLYGDLSDHRLWDELALALERGFTLPPTHPRSYSDSDSAIKDSRSYSDSGSAIENPRANSGSDSGATTRVLRAEAVAIDSGNWTQKVYDFCREAQAAFRPWYAIKGVDGQGRPIWLRSQAKLKGGGKLYIVGVDDAKSEIYGQLAKDRAGPGFIHFPGHLDLDWFEQLVAERILIEFKGSVAKRRWDCPRGKRNEALDCLVYATAARYSLEVDYTARRHLFSQPEAAEPRLADLAGAFV